MATQASPGTLGIREKAAYGLGDFASNLIWATTLTYIVFFYTDIYRIPAASVAGILLFCRIANAAIDPLIGIAIDKRHAHGERARPFLKWGALPLAVTTALVFLPLEGSHLFKVLWAAGTFMLLSVTYSFVNTAYGMLTNLMTASTAQRIQLTSARLIGANVGSVLIGWITLTAVGWLGAGDSREGFLLFMSIIGVVVALAFLVTHRFCRETVRPATAQVAAPGRRGLARALMANRPWLVLTAIKFLNSTANTLSLGSVTFAAIYEYRFGAAFGGTMIATITAASFIGCWIAPALVRLLGSRASVRITNFAQACMFLGLAVVPAHPVGIIALLAGIGLMIGMRDPVTYAMLSDTLDYGVARTGVDAMGLGYAIASAAYKVAAGVGGALLAALLAHSGYQAGAAVQPDSAILAIRLGLALLPAALLILSGLATFAYPRDAEIEDCKAGGLRAA
ncbi:glycoside-pentoside-hexuronide (GPH):cation symporter [Sphingobium sp. H39-3-25]|uniref:MFS transporter n=1 Tax=Sphingobium arseniciresistens TaxID=3030834 RepID=UPI0023BA1B33|nr:glycoside-pentoside-hexuronide (GPH):cation symporter [Sphingobium arseniciresistens]